MDPIIDILVQTGGIGVVAACVVLTARSLQPVAIEWLRDRRAARESADGTTRALVDASEAQRADYLRQLSAIADEARSAREQAERAIEHERECLRRQQDLERRVDRLEI